jgi:hypothetical protein
VVITLQADGMAALWAMDARRADILTALLTGRLVLNPDPDSATDGAEDTAAGSGRPIQPVTPGKPLVQVVMPYSTLTGADQQPCELVGHGPIPASLARDTAAESVWQRLGRTARVCRGW